MISATRKEELLRYLGQGYEVSFRRNKVKGDGKQYVLLHGLKPPVKIGPKEFEFLSEVVIED